MHVFVAKVSASLLQLKAWLHVIDLGFGMGVLGELMHTQQEHYNAMLCNNDKSPNECSSPLDDMHLVGVDLSKCMVAISCSITWWHKKQPSTWPLIPIIFSTIIGYKQGP